MSGSDTAIPAGVALPDATPAPSPDPTPGVLTAAELAAETGATVERAERLLPVASAMVERYAPAAPVALKNEAAIRFAGYLLGSDYGGVVKDGLGPQDVEYTVNHANAWRNSGAGMLLTRWKRRRAGAIG